MGESVLGHPPPCFVLCTGRSAPVLVLLVLLLLLILILVLVLLVLLLLILVLLIFAADIEAPPSVSAIQLQFARKPAEHTSSREKFPAADKKSA